MFRPEAGEVEILIQKRGRIIFEQSFLGRDGKVDVFGPLFDATRTPVIVLPLTKDNKVVAIRQFRYGANEFVLEIPGGNPKSGQTPKECLLAELVEETGYQPEEVVVFGKGKGTWIDPASLRVRYIPFLALGCRWIKQSKPDRTEIIETLEIPFAEWLEKIGSGEIDDSKTLAVTTLALLYLGMINP